MKKARVGIVCKLIGMATVPLISLGIILSVYGNYTLKGSLKNEIHQGLKSAAIAVQGAYDAAGNGDFILLESGNVIKGTFVVNGNYNLVDKLRDDSNIDVAFYYGEKVIVTSLLDENNARMLELSPGDEVIKKVLTEGNELFCENIRIGNASYYGYYMPIKNTDGTVSGMIFTGKKSASVEEILAQESMQMIGISVCVILVAAIFAVWIAAFISRALKYTIGSFGQVAAGKLTQLQNGNYEKRRDEIGDMIHGIEKLKDSLREVIGSIKESSEALMQSAERMENTAVMTNSNSNEVGMAIEEISKGAVIQAQDTEKAMENIEQMGGMIEQIVEDVHVMTDSANEMGRSGNEVSDIIAELEMYTKKTTDVVDVIARQINTTNSSTQEIRKAVEMITAIADETNLLSLNASIEAARAGEQGRGFAIVASQIQKLAEQSSQSAQQIGEVISVLLVDAENTSSTMGEVVSIVGKQKEKLSETGERFYEVNKGIQDSLERIEAIKRKSQVLNTARNEILQVVAALAQISEENAAAAEETTASTIELKERMEQVTEDAASLKRIAEMLEKQIEIFQL